MADLHTYDPARSLAWQLMHLLQRHRARSLSSRSTAFFFVRAIENAVDAQGLVSLQTAATAFCIDLLVLDKLAELGLRFEPHQEAEQNQLPLTSVEQRWLNNVFPELVRQIARVESGIAVSDFSYEFAPKTMPAVEASHPAADADAADA
jgi:hypothetical protein